MLQRLSMSLVQFFLAEKIISADEQEVYRYSVEVLLSQLLIYGSILLIAVGFGWIAATLAYYGGFLTLRHSDGGYHARTHWECALLTIATYLLAMVAVCYFPQEGLWAAVLLLIAVSLAGIIGFAPVDHAHKPFTSEERKRYRRQSLCAVSVVSVIVLALMFMEAKLAAAVILGTASASLSVIVGSVGRRRKDAQKIYGSQC